MRRSQVAMEYVMIVGFATLIAIPLFIIFNFYTMETRDEVVLSQADNIATKIVDSAESVYYMGEPSKTTIKIYMPVGIDNITIQDGYVVLRAKTKGSETDVVKSSKINITGTLNAQPGIKNIIVEARGAYVWVEG